MEFPTEQSYGLPFNKDGGGWYVMHNTNNLQRYLSTFLFYFIIRLAVERSDSEINIWFWSRHDFLVPFEIKEGSSIVDPLTWVR